MNVVSRIDASLAVTRPLWHWLGQAALIVLGTHLAADRLDDHLATVLSDLPVAWPDPHMPFDAGLIIALVVELTVAIWAVRALAQTVDQQVSSPRQWAQRGSVHNIVGPLFWLPVSLAGSWTLVMAVEDLLPVSDISTWIAWGVGGIVAWRLAGTGLWQLIRCAPVPKRRTDGLLWAPALLLVAGYAATYGLPIWGWM